MVKSEDFEGRERRHLAEKVRAAVVAYKDCADMVGRVAAMHDGLPDFAKEMGFKGDPKTVESAASLIKTVLQTVSNSIRKKSDGLQEELDAALSGAPSPTGIFGVGKRH